MQFLRKFDSVTKVIGLHTTLCSRKQSKKESIAVFLQEQYLLAQRLCPMMTDKQLTILLLESIKPSIRRLVRARAPTGFAALLEYATQAEREETDFKPKKEPTKKQELKSQTESQWRINDRPPPDCRFCSGRHFHRDCPVLAAYRNTRPAKTFHELAFASESVR